MEKIMEFFNNLQIVHAVEFVFFAFVFFMVLNVLRKNNAKLIVVLFVIYTLIVVALCYMSSFSNYVALILIAVFVLGVVVLFATEIKRDIWSKRSYDSRHGTSQFSRNDANTCIEEIIKAVQNMSKNDVGAIIILSNGSLPNGVLESGVYLDADISAQLIESVFFPKTALHDGAMILYGTKIQAAGCFLPLAQEVNLSKEIGSRHRAGIGLTETVNVTAIIVSEETGIISIAKSGKLIRFVDTNTLRETLKQFYWQDLID